MCKMYCMYEELYIKTPNLKIYCLNNIYSSNHKGGGVLTKGL